MNERPALTPLPGSEPEPPGSHLQPSSPQGQAAAALVLALAKAARAFTLYEPGNAVVRQFISDYAARAQEATAKGPVELDVTPFELQLDKEAVYREEDRERSLAFKLFRDGVRRITFAQGVPPVELLGLLQILAVRFVGVRQAEDDIVTLVRKAEFASIEFLAVEGYRPEDDAPETSLRRRPGEPPQGFDTPFAKLPPPAPVAWAAVPQRALAELHAEETPDQLGASGVRLAGELIAWAAHGALPPEEVAQFCGDVREFLVADRRVGQLASLAELAQRLPAGRLREELMRGLADARLLEAVLGSASEQDGPLPAEAQRLFPFVPASAVLDHLVTAPGPKRRAALLEVIEARLPADADAVAAKLPDLPADLVRLLLGRLAAKAPERADQVSLALLAHEDTSLRIEALHALAGSSHRVPAAALLPLLGSPLEEVRIAAAQALEWHGDTAAARTIADALTSRKSYSRNEAIAFGRTLGALHAGAALRLFDEWLEHKRRLLAAFRSSEHEDLLRWAAVAGLGAIPGAEADQRLEAVAGWADDELRRHVHGTVARRRAEARRRG